MKIPCIAFLGAVAVAGAGSFAQAESKPPHPCALLSKAEAVAALGGIKGEPAAKDALRGQKCSFESVDGAWLSVEVYSAEAHWDLVKNMALNTEAISGLGDEAFSAKRGETRQVYVKKGAWVIEVDSSAGADAARKAAAAAVKRLP